MNADTLYNGQSNYDRQTMSTICYF